jgi:hypothetical protein
VEATAVSYQRGLDRRIALNRTRQVSPVPVHREPACALVPTATLESVVTTRKSAASSFVSWGTPDVAFLTKLYCEVLPRAAPRFVPSRRRSKLPPVLSPKPTASREVVLEIFAISAVAKRPTLRSFSMSALSGRFSGCLTPRRRSWLVSTHCQPSK